MVQLQKYLMILLLNSMQNERVIWGIFPVDITADDGEGVNIDGFWADVITKYLLPMPIINSLFIASKEDEFGVEYSAFKFYPYSVNNKKTWIRMMWTLYLNPFKKVKHRDN